jgi:hypothetical protein
MGLRRQLTRSVAGSGRLAAASVPNGRGPGEEQD